MFPADTRMSGVALFTGDQQRFLARGKNRNLQQRTLEPTEENRKLVAEYNQLAADINAIPQRIVGLQINFRRREIPAHTYRLIAERDEKMARLMDIEKILFPISS